MRSLKFVECGLVAGGQERPEVTELDEIIVRGEKMQTKSVPWYRDWFGFDTGSFNWRDVGPGQGEGHVVLQAGGLGVAIPQDSEAKPLVGLEVEIDIDPTNGEVGVGPSTGVSYDPTGVTPGLNVNYDSAGYWVGVPPPTGGIGFYPAPVDDDGIYYWGPPPGSELSHNPQRY